MNKYLIAIGFLVGLSLNSTPAQADAKSKYSTCYQQKCVKPYLACKSMDGCMLTMACFMTTYQNHPTDSAFKSNINMCFKYGSNPSIIQAGKLWDCHATCANEAIK